MISILKTFSLLCLIFGLVGCSSAMPEPSKETLLKGDNSRTSVDWNGTYRGILPCADCEGIKTELILSLDGAYTLNSHYLGKSKTPFVEQGTFRWDESGGRIILEGLRGGPIWYRVGENRLIMLDQNAQAIQSNIGTYELIKTSSNASAVAHEEPIQEVYWKLIGIMGKAVVLGEKQREPYIMLKIENNRVQGFGGCNIIMGSYELKEGQRIHFSKMASTMMACPYMEEERALFHVLEKVDNYTIKDGVLMLNKARMAPLATFEAVYLQ